MRVLFLAAFTLGFQSCFGMTCMEALGTLFHPRTVFADVADEDSTALRLRVNGILDRKREQVSNAYNLVSARMDATHGIEGADASTYRALFVEHLSRSLESLDETVSDPVFNRTLQAEIRYWQRELPVVR